MPDYIIVINDQDKTAKAIKQGCGYNPIMKTFYSKNYKSDAVKWCKVGGGRNTTFKFVTEAEYFGC